MIPLLCPEALHSGDGKLNIIDKAIDLCSDLETFRQVISMEVIATFVFVNVVLNVKYHCASHDHLINAMIISISLYIMQLMAQEVSGGCLNPVIGVVQSIY